jgi:hypothetical protein
MSTNYAFSRLEHFYAQVETTFGQIPNSDGTASLSGSTNFCRHIKFSAKPDAKLIERPDKTGSRSRPIGALGRKNATWNLQMSAAMNGVAGTKPDCDPLFQMSMGQAGSATSGAATCTAATSVTPVVVTAANIFANGDVVNASNGGTYIGTFLLSGVSSSGATLLGSTAAQSTALGTATLSRVGYKYALSDSIVSGSLWSFRTPSTIDQRVVSGAVVQEYQVKLGADVADLSFQGEGLWMLSSNQFSVADTTQKAGLTAFPTEPATIVSNGSFITGFVGCIVVNGQLIATIQTLDLRAGFQSQLVKNTFGTYYPSSTQGDVRNVGVNFTLYEDDSAAYQNLIQIAEARTPVTIFAAAGNAPGSILCNVLNSVQLTPPDYTEEIRYIASFPDSSAHETAIGAHDELVVWCM